MRVDMYLLRDGAGEPGALACRLAGKAWPAHATVQIACDDQQQCRALDQQLWQLPENRFIAHQINGADSGGQAPVQITMQPQPAGDNSVLIELRGVSGIADDCGKFTRILDIVANSDGARAQARQRYKAYRQLTNELHTHTLS